MSNMKNCLDENDVIGSIRSEINSPVGKDKIWIIVEGETDERLFKKLIDANNIDVQESYGGCGKVKLILKELLEYTENIIGIRDADFMHLENEDENIENIFMTDYHDSEMMLIMCDKTFNEVISEYLKNEKKPEILRENIFKSIIFIGGLRWINSANDLGFLFKGLGLGGFYDVEKFELDEERYLLAVLGRSENKKKEISKEEVIEKTNGIYDYKNLCNGHDFQKALALCIKKGIKEEEIGKAFRFAYNLEKFKLTQLYSELKKWEKSKSNKLFKI